MQYEYMNHSYFNVNTTEQIMMKLYIYISVRKKKLLRFYEQQFLFGTIKHIKKYMTKSLYFVSLKEVEITEDFDSAVLILLFS